MIAKSIQAAKNELIEGGLASQEEFVGCSSEEIVSIEHHLGICLPNSYKEFLRVMGHSAGAFLAGTDYAFPKMLAFRPPAEQVLRNSHSDYQLPLTAFVFMFHQGYTFLFFDCQSPHDDPPVFMFTEMEKIPRMIADHFSAWVVSAVEDDITAYRELNQR